MSDPEKKDQGILRSDPENLLEFSAEDLKFYALRRTQVGPARQLGVQNKNGQRFHGLQGEAEPGGLKPETLHDLTAPDVIVCAAAFGNQ